MLVVVNFISPKPSRETRSLTRKIRRSGTVPEQQPLSVRELGVALRIPRMRFRIPN